MSAANVQSIQAAVLAQDQYCNQLRQTGEQTLATILTAEETNIRAAEGGSVFRFTFMVRTQIGESFRAETQAAIADAARDNTRLAKMSMFVMIQMGIRNRLHWNAHLGNK